MTAAVADMHQIDRRQCRAAAERRFSLARMAADYERLYRAILARPGRLACGRTGSRRAVTAPWSAGQAPVIPGLPGATVTLIEGSTFCISEVGRRHRARRSRKDCSSRTRASCHGGP